MSSIAGEAARAEIERGAVVVIADRYSELAGKPRPAVVLQNPVFATATLTVCLITSIAAEAPLLRIPLASGATSGLVAPSWAQVDQVVTIRRARIGGRIGRLDDATMLAIGRALMVFRGLA